MLIVCLRERVNMTDKTFFLLAIDPDTVVEQRERVNSALRLLLQPCLLSQCFLLDIHYNYPVVIVWNDAVCTQNSLHTACSRSHKHSVKMTKGKKKKKEE